MIQTALLFAAGLLAPRTDGEPSGAPQVEQVSDPRRIQLDEEGSDAVAGRAALERALDWLAKEQAQQPDGSLPTTGARQEAPLAVTSLAALAWMASGSTPERGPHGAPLAAAVDYLLGRVELSPESKITGYISDSRDQLSRMHGHGFATLALAEAYAMSPRSPRGRRIERALKLAIQRIESSQGSEGAWYYSPERSLEHEGSVTIALVQALRAARNSGLRVNPEVIKRAVDYVRRSQAEDGSFRYAIGHEETSVALTAAAISTMNATGIYSGEEVIRGYASIQRELIARETVTIKNPTFPVYERLYLAQAYWQHPDRALFRGWFQAEREQLIALQEPSGAWPDARFGSCYATATNALVLALPDSLLPIFQR
ncbi:MAG: terpene cyclase/mutase family protein [Planctomycetes bacterium]|nr:terpene cyclase/mutase family protein [Planctomycetota bacterium]